MTFMEEGTFPEGMQCESEVCLGQQKRFRQVEAKDKRAKAEVCFPRDMAWAGSNQVLSQVWSL